LLVIAAFVLVAINANNAPTSPTQSVVVATADLQPRIPIEATSLAIKSLPTTTYQDILFTKVSDVVGTVPLVKIVAGQPISSNLVAKPGDALGSQSAFLPIPSGYVALTIPTSEQQGVAGNIQPDDYIAIIATVSSGAKTASLTVFANVHVIRVGTPAVAGGGSGANSLTVVVTECQAEYITWFLNNASLKYTLESQKDYLSPGSQTKDPLCPSASSTKGVTQDLVQKTFPTLF
jgi:Flp pilus assembly protein CpaB